MELYPFPLSVGLDLVWKIECDRNKEVGLGQKRQGSFFLTRLDHLLGKEASVMSWETLESAMESSSGKELRPPESKPVRKGGMISKLVNWVSQKWILQSQSNLVKSEMSAPQVETLTVNSWDTLGQNHSSKLLLNSWTTETMR